MSFWLKFVYFVLNVISIAHQGSPNFRYTLRNSLNTELNQEVAHVLLQMVVKSLMRKPQVLMLDELVQSTLQKGTTVDCCERRTHWHVGPTQIVEVNIDDINDNNANIIDSIIVGDLTEEQH